MRRLLRFTPLVFASVLLLAALSAGGAWSGASAARADVVPDNYIVTFKPGVEARTKASEKARAYGLQVRHVYSSAISGFAGFIPPGQLKRLQNDPDVATIVEDRRVFAFNDQRPTGVRRSQADRNSTAQIGSHTNPIDVDVAVLDTGIQPDHPDLNVVGGVSCVPGEPSYSDANGHGTHVAGTIAALDNGSGVVGVAPGARLWAVRVLDASGEGQFSDVICGIDWVTANAATIEVANMSLGGEEPVDSCTDGSLHAAICRSVDAGITYVVASGNAGIDASRYVPAAYPEVITVSAIVDTDGAPGGRGTTSFFYGDDDELATFSNFGAPVDIAAPGVNIYSTWPGGGYTYSSGTSMASPHVAGAAAVYLYLNPGSSPASVQSYLLSIAWEQGSAEGFTQDVDGFAEPLLNAGAVGGPPLPPPAPTCALSASEGIVGSSVKVTCANFGSSESVRIHWDGTATTQRTSFYSNMDGGGTATLTVPDATGGEHQVIALGATSGIEFSVPFTVKPGIKLSSASGKVGSYTLVTLSGFAANEAIALTWDEATSPLATATASTSGRALLSLTIPEAVAGEHVLTAAGSASIGTPASSVQATFTVVPGVSLVPSNGRVGTAMTITLRGYAADEEIDVSWQDSPTGTTSIVQVTASSLGSATATFTVPEATRGAHQIEGIGGSGNVASAPFSVTAAISLSDTSGAVGSGVTVTLLGFDSGESVALKWYDTQTTATQLGSVFTSERGGASIRLSIPEATGGSHRLEAVGAASGSRSAYFTVRSSIVLVPDSGQAGESVTATVAGYRGGETVTIKWYSTTYASTSVSTATASDKGSATASFTVPAGASAGEHKVEATGGSSYARASTAFLVTSSGPTPTIDPACSIDTATGPVGTRVAVSCTNFAVNEAIRIYWDDTTTSPRASIWTGTAGGGTTTFTVPDSTAGSHRIIAVGGTSSLRVEQTFTIVPSFTLLTSSSKVGGYVSATLKGFAANETVKLTWDGGTTLKTVAANATGAVSTSFSVPEAPRGEHRVEAIGNTSSLNAGATLEVVPSVAVSPMMGAVGSTATVTLRGYAAGEDVAINWYVGNAARALLATVTASPLGSTSITFTVPEGIVGDHMIDGIGAAGSMATASFRIRPALSMSPTSGAVGSTIDLTLSGFAADEAITVQWFETSTTASTIATLSASSEGSAAATLAVPESSSGIHKVQVSGSVSGATLYQYYSVRASISLSPVSGPAGTTVTLGLTGYRASETINVAWFTSSYASIAIASGVANGVGSATVTFAIPTDATTGDHQVQATGQSSFQRSSTTFNVTALDDNGTPGVESLSPTFDPLVTDDFSHGTHGAVPPGWSVSPGSSGEIAVTLRGNRVGFGAAPGTSGSAFLIKDGAIFSQADVQVKLRITRDGSGAGIVLAWNGPDSYIAVVANSEADRFEVIEVVGGTVRTVYRTKDGTISIGRGHDYWLRAESGVGNGAWINLYWSGDGNHFEPLGVAKGLLSLTGGVGLVVGGRSVPDADFDDFVARKSQSTGPLQIADEDAERSDEATEVADPAPPPTEEIATPEPAPTEVPAPTEEPSAPEEPSATPVPTQEPAPTTEPTPTAEPATEQPAESESTPSEADPEAKATESA